MQEDAEHSPVVTVSHTANRLGGRRARILLRERDGGGAERGEKVKDGLHGWKRRLN